MPWSAGFAATFPRTMKWASIAPTMVYPGRAVPAELVRWNAITKSPPRPRPGATRACRNCQSRPTNSSIFAVTVRVGVTVAWAAIFFVKALGAQVRARPEVALNHVYVTVDSATLAAAETSAYLANRFGHVRRATNRTADGRSWTGVYLFGERTYVELFPSGVRGGVGFSGLALSVEEPGAIDSVAAWLTARFGPVVRRSLVQGSHEGRSFPWFHSVSVDHPRGDSLWQVYSWFMENHPEFYRVVQQDTTGRAEDISRKRYLKRRYRTDLMLREIVGLSLALVPAIGEQLAAELEALGWRIERRGESGRYRAVGREADIVVAPVAHGEPYGIRELRFALNHGPATPEVHALGNSRLEVCANVARWTFGTANGPAAASTVACR